MQYPLISEYIDAILSAEDNMTTLNNLRPVLDDKGRPVMSLGNFAVVFKMKSVDSGRCYAIKCFIKDQEGRAEAYQRISEELEFVSSPYLLHVQYLENELFVDTTQTDQEEFPVLKMEWMEGKPLDAYLRENIHDSYALEMLTYRFCRMGAFLLSQPFAHGDLKPDNILVRENGELALVDYDGMFVPSMEGQKARELGSPDFRHPLRDENQFDSHIDDFAIASIALSLKAIALDSSLLEKYGAADRLLFSAEDYRNLGESNVLKALVSLSSDTTLASLLSAFLLASAKNNLSMLSFRLFSIAKPEKKQIELSTEVTEEDLANAVEDEFGVKYSKDGLRLLKSNKYIRNYVVKAGTRVICDRAFLGCSGLTSVTIPNSVTSIGDRAFAECKYIENVYCYAEEVPSTDFDAFDDSNIENATLYVPASAIEAYKTTEPWSYFGTIKAIEVADGVESVKERGIAIQSAGGFINISGLDTNDTVSFYALDGKALGTAKSIDGNVSFSAKQGTIVVARIGKESVKIAVK